MRNLKISPDEHYHIFNRGINKQVIFHNHDDYSRFLFLIFYFQMEARVTHVSREVKEFKKFCVGQSSALATSADQVTGRRLVEIVAFCVMPNHFHLMVRELEEGGMATYMQRVLTAYSKYYNTKYERTGHVFQGPYRAVHIEDDIQTKHLSAYIHRNPRELQKWFGKETKYPWSSYQDFIGINRWGDFITPGIILGEFKDKKHYKRFVESSLAKTFEGENRK